jgi:hypothetical protein
MRKTDDYYSSWYKECAEMKAEYQKELRRRKVRLLLCFIAAVSVYFIAAILKHV